MPGRIKMPLVPGNATTLPIDIQALLHRRLRFFSILTAVGTAVTVLFVLLSTGNPWYFSAFYGVIAVAAVVIAGILWRPGVLSVFQLRTIELVLMAAVFAYWTATHAAWYPFFRLDQPPIWFGGIMSAAISLPWVFIILLYGIFIPNTWRRCAAVLVPAAIIPFVISGTTGIASNATHGQFSAFYWGPLALWMAMAAAVGIYGSHRIETLRVEVSDARKLGQYQLKHRLGSGGMGEVYIAEHVLLRRPCAVKIIRSDRNTDLDSLRRFEREVQATAALTHPNTVQVYDYGHAEDGTFYYAMEYLPGLDLTDLVKRNSPLPPERVVHLIRQVCGALHEAHLAGLIHRDIKPSNIITCERGGLHDVAKLLDFGLVRSHGAGDGADNLTQDGAITGTPAYMSPEQADGKKDLGPSSDIYSLGAVAYFLLTGQPPFVRPTALQTLIAHLSDAVSPPSAIRNDVPADLQAVVMRCLQKDPTQRFPDARSMDAALAGCHAAGLWTEERAAAWQHTQGDSPSAVVSTADATTIGA